MNITRFLYRTSVLVSLFICFPVNGQEPLFLSGASVIFEDGFGQDVRGERIDNLVQLEPPKGLGYFTRVPWGYAPKKWMYFDIEGLEDPRKGMWVIPEGEEYMEQAGRSRSSWVLAEVPIPEGVASYTVEFEEYRHDNDRVTYLLGLPDRTPWGGFEFGAQLQIPGTDETTDDVYLVGALGEDRIEGAASFRKWAEHRIEVVGQHIRWSKNGEVLAEGVADQPLHGYFGIRHRYERGTRYDDVRITTYSNVLDESEEAVQLWLEEHFTAEQITEWENGYDADPDKDGLSNRWERRLGLDPTSYESRLALKIEENELVVPGLSSASGVELIYSQDLEDWSPSDISPQIVEGIGLRYDINKPEFGFYRLSLSDR